MAAICLGLNVLILPAAKTWQPFRWCQHLNHALLLRQKTPWKSQRRRTIIHSKCQPIYWKQECMSWWRHKMETFSALLAICAGNSPVTGEFPAQRPVTRSFDVFFDLHLNKRLSKQSWGWWFHTPSRPLWRHCNVIQMLPMDKWIHIRGKINVNSLVKRCTHQHQ